RVTNKNPVAARGAESGWGGLPEPFPAQDFPFLVPCIAESSLEHPRASPRHRACPERSTWLVGFRHHRGSSAREIPPSLPTWHPVPRGALARREHPRAGTSQRTNSSPVRRQLRAHGRLRDRTYPFHWHYPLPCSKSLRPVPRACCRTANMRAASSARSVGSWLALVRGTTTPHRRAPALAR